MTQPTGCHGRQRESVLANKVVPRQVIFVHHCQPQQGHLWETNHPMERLIPYRVETWKRWRVGKEIQNKKWI